MNLYSRVSYGERCQIFALLQSKISIIHIAKQLGRHKSTIYREIKRNSVRKGGHYESEVLYVPAEAQAKARNKFRFCRKKLKIDKNLSPLVLSLLRYYLSPEQISGRLYLEKKIRVSHQAIYNFIKQNSQYRGYLCYQGIRHYRHRRNASVKHGGWVTNISERPIEANERRKIGHWERDLMYAKNRAPILVCTDRKSRFTKLTAIPSAKINDVSKFTHTLLKSTCKKVWTVTNDNGLEFRSFNSIKYPTYFCDPYRPQQRGTIENTIGVIRRFVKSKTDIKTVNFEAIEMWLNLRPRKVLDYRTPYEVFFNKSVALVS